MKSQHNIPSRLVHARIQLLLSQPFFGSLCLRLKMQEGEVSTMATDGRRILYNPEFARQLSAAELEAVLAHEVMHCALGHHCRRGQRDPRLWNRAADLAINPLLVANHFQLPPGALIDAAFSGMSAEEIYAELKRQEDASGGRDGKAVAASHSGNDEACGKNGLPGNHAARKSAPGRPAAKPKEAEANSAVPEGAFGEVVDAVDENGQRASEPGKLEQQREWSVAAEQAQRSAAACGRKPAGVERPLEQSRSAPLDWRAILRNFISAQAPQDYRWSPPNRRYVSAGLYLPSVEKTGLGEIVIAVDTSGSIRGAELEQFAAEISAIAEEAQPERIHVVCADAAVQSEREFTSGEPVAIEPIGGGGTDFRPGLSLGREKRYRPGVPDLPHRPALPLVSRRRRIPGVVGNQFERESSDRRDGTNGAGVNRWRLVF